MTAEVQTPNNIPDVPNKKIKLNEEGGENFKDDAYKEILKVEISRREKAEAEVAALNRRNQLLEEDMTRAEERCAFATKKWKEASQQPQSTPVGGQAPSLGVRPKPIGKEIETEIKIEKFEAEDLAKRIQGLLSLPLAEFPTQAKVIADETTKKYEAATTKLAMVEVNLEHAQEKAKNDESKIVELENELKVLSKSLQVSVLELKEEAPSEEITFSNMETEARAQFAEGNVEKLQNEVDKLKEELQAEQERNKNLQEEMEATLQDIQNM